MVNLLKPFLDATELLSGSKYTTLSFLYPTMYLLMDMFSMNDKSDDELFDLIYGPEDVAGSGAENEHENLEGNISQRGARGRR